MRTVCFCFSGGNETPGFLRFLSGFVSIPPLKVSAPQEIFLRISPDRGLVGAITEILIKSEVRVQIHGDPVQLFAICRLRWRTRSKVRAFRRISMSGSPLPRTGRSGDS